MFGRGYGERPLHLIAAVASFAIVAYAVFQIADRPQPLAVALWFGGAIIAHDLITFPLYSLLGLIAGRAAKASPRPAARAVNFIRVPAILSAFAFIVFFPFILGVSAETYELASGRSSDVFLGRWLLLTAALFAASGLLYAVSLRRGPRSGPARDPRGARSPR